MIIGIPREIKDNEYRVALAPSGAHTLISAGHRVLVETGAGKGSGFSDAQYASAGAEVAERGIVWKTVDMIVKVKEPLAEEYRYLRDGLIIFTFLHLAADLPLADELIKNRVTAIAYETVETDGRGLPILAPMSEIAGRLSVQIGVHFLLKHNGGEGVLIGGVPGVPAGSAVIIGAGTVGMNAAKIAAGLGARVIVLDSNVDKLRRVEDVFGLSSSVETLYADYAGIDSAVTACDLLIGAAHQPGARTPRLVTADMVSRMKKGAVIVDVSIDQGGCVETIRHTTHSNPVYYVSGVIHYGVANMPGAVPRTSTLALTNATMPYVLKIANLGFKEAVNTDASLKRGINIHAGSVQHKYVAEAIGKDWRPVAVF
ncbi:alanine dehydrogenase [bacterium]|nr:MAG: alanine dehydrogenase [bacterium]